MTGAQNPDLIPLATVALNGPSPEYAPCAGCNRIYRVATVTATGEPLCSACSYTGPKWDDPVVYDITAYGRVSREEALAALRVGNAVWVGTQRGTASGQVAHVYRGRLGATCIVKWPALQRPKMYQMTTPEAALVLAEYLVGQKPEY